MITRTDSFTVLIEQDDDGYFVATVPALRGCHTQARSMDNLIKRVKEAITLCLMDEPMPQRRKFIAVQQVEIE